MKRTLNKGISFLLAFIMVFSMGFSSFADDANYIETNEEVLIEEEIPYSEEVIETTEEKVPIIAEPILDDNLGTQKDETKFKNLEVNHLDAFTGEMISKDVFDLEVGKEVDPVNYILENLGDKFIKSSSPKFIMAEDSSFNLYYESDAAIGDNPDNLTMEQILEGEPISTSFLDKSINMRSFSSPSKVVSSNSNEWPNPGAINLSKAASPVQGSSNLWEISLSIEGKNLLTTSDTVLVLDISGSMKDGNKLQNMKSAANEFIDKLLLPDGVNRVAIVAYSGAANQLSGFVDYTSKSTLNSLINSLSADGGTNIQAGIHLAQNLLDASQATNKVMVLLSDGQPTYSYKVTEATGITLEDHWWFWTPDVILNDPQIVAVDYSDRVGNGSSFLIGESDSYQVPCTIPGHDHGPFDSGFPSNHGIPTIFEANLAKSKGTQIYSIAFNADPNGQSVLNSSQNAGYYQLNSSDLSPLNAVFSEISGKISYAAKDGVVVDPMGDMFDLASSQTEIVVSQGSVEIQGNTIIWNTGNIAEGNPATMKYIVRIKSGADEDILYPTNKETVFSYTDSNGNEMTSNFPIPKVAIGGGKIILIGYEVNENGEPINSEGVVVERPDLANELYNRSYADTPLGYNQTYTVTPDYIDGYQYQKYYWNETQGTEDSLDILLQSNNPTETVYFGYSKIKTVTVTFNENYPGVNEYTRTLNKGSSLGTNMPPDPKRIGYTFVGWNTNSNGTGSTFKSDTPVNQDITVYAQWEENIVPSLEITDYTGIYDGENHSIEVKGLVDGDKVYYSEDGNTWQEGNPSYTNAGEHKVYVKVENPNYEDREGFGTVKITPRDISIQSQSANKVYDGTPLTKNEFTIINGELVEGEEITVVITGSQTSVGSSKNTIDSISIKSGDTDVTENYNITKVEGTLTVTQPYYPPYIPPEEEIDEEVPTDLPELTDEHIAYIQGYPDNTIRPLAFITREEVATVFYRLLDPEYRSMVFSTEQNFLDVKATRWSNKHIATLVNAGVILGYEDGTFKPEKYITRAELAVIASRFDNLSPFESDKFSDIKGHWANKYINSAAEKGWVNGYEDGTFKPDNYISRAEFVTLVNQVLNRRVSKENILEDARQFPDLIEGKWYYEAMQEAINSHEFEWLEDDTEKWTKIYYPDLDM
ncbi:VWA domain-containing protein [Soehngenia longivitae]|uniref:VWA domain-containing protein n=1 Tax=Soehngenia longivitae TaxID=2562294 RepID=A0A4Z0D5M4_9FIRM|nr:S-layer homology domain-containing protein [Soehngenia longivitae]TFZ39953.1 VWA domain-containing protein [Soehngenia longivitae]